MVLSEGLLLVRARISLCRLGRLLRQHCYDECNDRVIYSLDALRDDFRRDLCSLVVPRLEAQSFHVPDAICRVGPVFLLSTMWDGESERFRSIAEQR